MTNMVIGNMYAILVIIEITIIMVVIVAPNTIYLSQLESIYDHRPGLLFLSSLPSENSIRGVER